MAAEQLAPREGLAHIAMGIVVQRDPHQIKQDRHQVRPLGFGSLAAAAVTLVYARRLRLQRVGQRSITIRSEEHTSELQSHSDLVCRLLLEKKKPLRCAGPLPSGGGARPR